MLHTTIKTMNALPPLVEGRKYFAVGPHCWGKDITAKKAISNAKSNFPSFAGKWKFLLYDAPADTYIDDMGSSYTETESKAVLVGYFNTNAEESPALKAALEVVK